MDTWLVVVIVVAAVAVVLALVGWVRTRRRRRLRGRFGPEYEREVDRAGSRREAEEQLAAREERREQFDIRQLPDESRHRYRERWETIQREFVDRPDAAIDDADRLIQEVMRERGYPVDDFEQRAADLSVDHPQVVEHYRRGHTLATSPDPGGDATEQLREAMLHYRALFDELLSPDQHRDMEASR